MAEAVRASNDGDNGGGGSRRPGCDVVRESIDETCGGVGGGVSGPRGCGCSPGEQTSKGLED